jgi:hypothetical protein
MEWWPGTGVVLVKAETGVSRRVILMNERYSDIVAFAVCLVVSYPLVTCE